MTTTTRPSLAKRQTRASKAKAREGLDEGLRLTVDGVAYEVRAGDLTALDTLALRKEAGFSFAGLMKAAADDFDIDVLAAIMWLSRRLDGEKTLRYEAVAVEVGYDVLDSIGTGDVEAPEDETPGE